MHPEIYLIIYSQYLPSPTANLYWRFAMIVLTSLCKVLHNILKAPEDLQYQLAFLSDELRQIFTAAPLPASAPASGLDRGTADSNRKAIEGDCPICFMELCPDTEEIVYCKAACGNNIHQSCFEV